MAARQGFEPRLTGPEPVVLPLHHRAAKGRTNYQSVRAAGKSECVRLAAPSPPIASRPASADLDARERGFRAPTLRRVPEAADGPLLSHQPHDLEDTRAHLLPGEGHACDRDQLAGLDAQVRGQAASLALQALEGELVIALEPVGERVQTLAHSRPFAHVRPGLVVDHELISERKYAVTFGVGERLEPVADRPYERGEPGAAASLHVVPGVRQEFRDATHSPLLRHAPQVLPIHPFELLGVEHRRVGSDALETELLD